MSRRPRSARVLALAALSALVGLTATSACAGGSAQAGAPSSSSSAPSTSSGRSGDGHPDLVTGTGDGLVVATTLVPPKPSLELAEVEQLGLCTFAISLDERVIGFEKNSPDLTSASEAALLDLLPGLRDAETVLVEGHASTEGDPARNQTLSEDRADTVMRFLDHHVDGPLFSSEGFGSTSTTVPERDEADRVQNRRVRLVVKLAGLRCPAP